MSGRSGSATGWVFLFALALATGQASAVSQPALLELLAPIAGEVAVAGRSLRLEWRSGPDWDPGGGLHEWEAFLSLDGGATYLFRLTPHLDIEQRWAIVELPPIPSPRARLLIRVGDERREREAFAPVPFVVVAPPVELPVLGLSTGGRGEAARPGGPRALSWVERTSKSGRSVTRHALEEPAAWRPQVRAADWHLALLAPPEQAPSAPGPRGARGAAVPPAPRGAADDSCEDRPAAIEPRRATCRCNE